MINLPPPGVFQQQPATLPVEDPPSLSRNRRNVGEPARYWPQNSTLKIAMYDYGNPP
ncbi:MAG: hypothetical protein GAK37_02647 [Pseudomonas sp.]|nr:MAG: hypothetical protein GAK37_02647 [Pseudomonas sp.]